MNFARTLEKNTDKFKNDLLKKEVDQEAKMKEFGNLFKEIETK